MKKKMILLGCAILVVLIAVITLSGMLKKSKPDILSQLNGPETQDASLPETTLTIYFQGKEPQEAREVLDALEKKMKGSVNAHLDFKYIWAYNEDYMRQIREAISSGQPCDAYFYSQNFNGANLANLAKEGFAKDITELFPKFAPNYYKNFGQEYLRSISTDGKLYAVPYNLPQTNMRCALVRDDLMKKYNISDIKNYSDFENYLDTIHKHDTSLIPTTFYDTAMGLFAEAGGYVTLDYSAGLVYKWDDPDMKLVAWEQTPAFKEGINRLWSWFKKGYVSEDPTIAAGQIDEPQITSGKWASLIAPFGSEISYNSLLQSKNISWRYKAFPLYPNQTAARTSPMDSTLVISPSSKNAERVLTFINWLQSDQENYDALMYGIKGKTYLLDGNRLKLPDGVKYDTSCLTWVWRQPFSNINYERVDQSTDEETIKAYEKTLKNSSRVPPHLGFLPDYGSVSDIWEARRGSFYSTETKVYTGTYEDGDVDSYIKEQKDLGADKLVAEIQRQLDQWKAANPAK